MQKEFKREIKSEFSHRFEVTEEGLYSLSVKASCKPGWRNRWWLKFKGLLEDILDLHLDDEDLRLEIDNIIFTKPHGEKGLFNSPSAFSGTKTLGKTKTVIFLIYLAKGEHNIRFIPDGSPYLESVTVEPLDSSTKFICYLHTQAEDENYYAWYTVTSVNLQLRYLQIAATTDVVERETDDADLKILINGKVQKRKENSHPQSYFCGFTSRGKEETLDKEFNLAKDLHYIELFADKKPILKSVKIGLEKEQKVRFNDPQKKKDVFNPKYVLKDTAFLDNSSLTEEEIEEFLRKHSKEAPNHIYHKIVGGRKVSYWIKKFTFEAEVNTKLILAKLQAETGLIYGADSINPTSTQLNRALGVGVTDTKTFSEYQGFLTQLENAPQLFKQFFTEIKENTFTHPNVDGKSFTVVNRATYSLYKYTPHVEGASLFYRVYAQLFGKGDLGGGI